MAVSGATVPVATLIVTMFLTVCVAFGALFCLSFSTSMRAGDFAGAGFYLGAGGTFAISTFDTRFDRDYDRALDYLEGLEPAEEAERLAS